MQPPSFNEPSSSAGVTPQSAPAPGSQLQNAALPSITPIPDQSGMPATPQSSLPAAQPGTGPELADDGDLIEKEWVSQVKRIVTATANDPYQQNVEFTRLKAEYMQKRYGKQIKVED